MLICGILPRLSERVDRILERPGEIAVLDVEGDSLTRGFVSVLMGEGCLGRRWARRS